jgi:hypothetical protein
MNRTLRSAAVASLAALAIAMPAAAQTDPHQHEQATQPGPGSQGIGGMGMGGGMMGGQDMGGMMRMMQGCPMMQGGGGRGLPHLPPGNEKLELQMHADMMKAMGDIMAKYAARLPDKK